MWQRLVVLAIVANTALITPSEGNKYGPYPEKSNHGNPHRKCKKPNEIFDLCPNPCPPRECGINKALILCAPAPKPGSKNCKPGCRCADGFLKNRAGFCIPENECQYDCAKNETLDPCYSDCPPRFCGVNIAAVSCLAIDEYDCERGCRCSDGYLRNAEGDCVLEADCPQCRNLNEVYDVCPAPCPPRRCDVDETLIDCKPGPRPGDPECEPGCRCADGFVRNPDGICVTRDQCPQCYGPNEEYDVCPNPCPPQRCDVDPRVIRCPAPPEPGDPRCEPGCRCFYGYARNDDGICVPREECPQYCPGPNEVYDICPNPCPPQRCDVDPRVIRCKAPPQPGDAECEPGCRCVDGHVRNDQGVCVLRDQCPQNSCKGDHEIYARCPALVRRPLNCTQVGFPMPLINPGPDPSRCPGKPGCICENGYARNKHGKCIPLNQCPECGGDPNAVSGCGVNCGRHCSDRNKTEPVSCITECKENSCDCRKGFWYDDNTGECVLSQDCTPTCGKDEVYSACTNSDCGPQKCSQLGFPIPCPRIDPANCIKGCSCKEGFVRAANGTCIPKEKCPSCGGDPNAVSGCGNNCGRRCSNYNSTEPVICTLICNLNGCDCKKGFVLDDSTGKCIRPNQCVSCAGDFNAKPGCDKNCTKRCPGPKPAECKCYKDGCECKDGFLYDPKIGKCVRLEQCTPPCGDNEVLSNCSNGGCGPWRCTDIGIPTGCVKMDQKYCTVDCVCKEGYVRDDNEVCVPVTDCPECGGDPNAIAGCGINCGRLCSNYKNAENVSCIAVCLENACDCREGFVLDENINKCVKPEHCTPTCGINEVFSECINGGCQAKNCSQIGESVPCVKPAKCNPGCLCADGYLRDAKGICIPKDRCPPKCTGANEIYDPCPPSCPPQTCESIGQKYFCPLMSANKTSKDCHGACRCKPNFFRNKIGECISVNNCLKCTGPNEYFSCGGACDNVCETLSKQNQTNCPIVNIKCNEMCYCEEGYARNKYNICVPICQCPGKCSENERWEECPATLCSPQSCKDLGFNITCETDENNPCPGKPGCVCDYDFVRNEDGKCIPKKQCPSCGGDPNAESGCGLNCGRLCSNYDKGPVPCPRICYLNACDCKKDFVFDENIKKCVCPEQCTPVCKEHEVYSECINGGCQARNCTQLGQPVPCIKLDPKSCIKGCVCEDGYLRARNGTCVPVDKCDNCNKPHEHYDPCAPSCPPQTCESIGRLYKCPATAAVCRGACRCDKGYLRNKKGECIRRKDCLKCTGPHEYWLCGSACDNVCKTLYKQNQTNCPIKNIKCNEMCYCEEGYARNKYNICIPIDDCPKPRCGVNERLENCPPGLCTPQKCTELGFPIACPDLPENGCPEPPGCVCADNYVRDSRGRCIPSNLCPSCGGDPNAVSGCGVNCGRTCATYNRTDIACITICYFNACDCRKGYVFDDNLKRCVQPKDCTPTCGNNEVYDSCANGGCGKWNCTQLGQPDLCIDPFECIGGCICQKGYLRAKNGTCVPINQCPIPPCGENERFEFCPDSVCDAKSCSELGFPLTCPTLTEEPSCSAEPACICDYGFVRNANGDCIPKNECPSCGGDPNAVSGCGVNCGRTCATYNRTDIACIAICYLNACDCRKGYVFDDNLKRCVQPKDCTPICGNNEVYDSCANGGCGKWNCTQLGQPDLCIDPLECIGGCICQKGYLRTKNGTCVPINQCPIPPCGENERFEFCPDSVCEPKSCSELGFPLTCPALTGDSSCSEEPACICDNGFVRNANGNCIPKKNCPSCGGDPNAESGCGINCGRLCSNYNKGPVPCPKICKINACDCKKDFVLDLNTKKCVRPEQCTPICGKDEVFSECINGGCLPKNCSQLGKPVPCLKIDPKYCIKGCLCKEGYLREANGVCVPKEDCRRYCCEPNEVYDPCPPSCPPQTCESINKTYHCPLMKTDIKDCKPACRCKEGYWRNKIGQCISKANCLKCTGPNEYWSCGSACDNVCENLHEQNQTNCPIKNIKCTEMCYCEEGYARDDKNVCVPINQCPPPKCGENERLEECPDWLCTPQCCTQLGYPVACPALLGDVSSNATCPGRPGCVCIDNYVRHDCGECIPVDQCPSCGGDPNAVSGCGINCGRLCSNYKKKNVICPLVCKINGCDCREGFVFDNNLDKCVLPKDCTQVCGNNEVYDICANGGCQKRNCSQLRGPILCIDPIKCIGGCVCQEGFLRNKDGDCVSEDQCPLVCTKPHEVYDPCPRTCPPQTCAAIGLAYPCPRPPEGEEFCHPACRCEDGYYRNTADECISEEDCLKCTGPNEHFSCGPPCDNVCATLATQNQTNCPYINKRCNSQCYCDEGYARDDNDICIPIDQCGISCHGDPNAISGCGDHCGNRCSDYNRRVGACPLICILDGCDCKLSYVFDDNLGMCVQPKDCTPVCGEDEVYNTCINGGCQKKKCSDLARPNICIHPRECIDGCLCKEGMLRADNGTCLPINECPTPACPENEVFDLCANGGCDRRKCSELTRPIICINPIECIGDCVCVKGFLRNEDGVCVRESECNPQCNKPHQVFDPCPSTCPPQTCESLNRAYICPIETGQDSPCQPGCVCEEGYFFNAIGECISQENCLKCMGPHEYFSCGVECDNVCATLSEQNKTNCPIVNIQCNEQCYCEDGFARNGSNICIPIEECPVPCNEAHKVFDPCPRTPRTCASLNNDDSCDSCEEDSCEEEPPCEPGCVCEEGYYENAIGQCLTKEECLKCTGPHEFYSCGGACDNVCITLNEQNQTDCPIINIKCNEMCYCEEGYARNASKICIPIEDCPPSRCGPDERYEENPCQVCEPLTCDEVGMDLECPPEVDDDCDHTPACICKHGLVRNDDGVCIPISECRE